MSDPNAATPVVIINVFRIKDPARLDDAIERLQAVNRRIAEEPGFLSATVHRGREGDRMANHAHWSSEAEIRAALGHPDLSPLLRRLQELAEGDWHLYDVVD